MNLQAVFRSTPTFSLTSKSGAVRRAALAACAVVTFALVSGCVGDTGPEPSTVSVRWSEQTLPPHPGLVGRNVARDAVECGDSWYVAGAVLLDHPSETRDTRPALWSSADTVHWNPVTIDARTYWGRRAILNSIACSRDRIVAVGARSGGAHGNPRVTTFYLDTAGTLVDVRAVFTQFGGVSATNVGPISGGPEGWLIVGNRLSGPGAWVSDDPQGFTRVEGEPGLTGGELQSIAQGGGWAGDGWIIVGAGAVPGNLLNRDPLAWTSPDGLTWTPEAMPASDESDDVYRVINVDGELIAVGLQGHRFAAWVRRSGEWSKPTLFGRVADDWTGAPYVASLAKVGEDVFASISDGSTYRLWRTTDGAAWREAEVPAQPLTAGDHTLAVGAGHELLLLADDGQGARIWTGVPG